MKFFIVVILVAICGSVWCGENDWEDNLKQCADKNKVKLEELKDALNSKIKEADVTNDMKCAFLCAAEKEKIIQNGAFQPQVYAEAVAATADKDQVAKITTECNVRGKDDCETAYKVGVCIAKFHNK
ncbi:general odorant-binding protein 56h-like [Episyrphus balteatus]|uniref:general odorant-binding protein 56h-like n=1 Tax=Episyrphus balteatus TaxID=286459 RepID=UPI002485F720|nr:general odorant-binding protein 56h-like [Episyrphus balteatus]